MIIKRVLEIPNAGWYNSLYLANDAKDSAIVTMER